MNRRTGTRGWWVALAVVAFFVVFGGGLFLVFWTATPSASTDGLAVFGGDRIAILPLRGVITGNHAVIRALRDYKRDGSIRGYVVDIDSPGGEVAPAQTIYQALREEREEGKPVVAVIGAIGASGAYYAALGADTVVAMPGSRVGSIGVIMEFPNATGMIDKVGLEFEVVKSGEHKDLGSPFRDMTEGDRALLQDVVDDVYQQFVEAVVEERGLSRDSVLRVADGRLMSGRQAATYGLIDRQGDLSEALAIAGSMAGLGPEPRTVRPQERRPVTWLDLLTTASRWVASSPLDPASPAREAVESWVRQGPRLFYMARP